MSAVLPPVTGLDGCADVATYGGKAAALAAVAAVAPVPPSVCVPAAWFAYALGDRAAATLAEVFEDLAVGSGAGVLLAAERAGAALADLTAPPHLVAALRAAVAALPGSGPLAVRSSAVGEDGAATSAAGVYRTGLDVPEEEVAAALTECWRSYYALPAIAARSFASCFDPAPAMAVLVQRMVPARWAGVAFSRADGTVLVEGTRGIAAALVDGAETGEQHVLNDANAASVAYGRELVDVTRRLAGAVGGAVDVEWAFDGDRLVVLQARRQTSSVDGLLPRGGPVFRVADLYAEHGLPPEFVLGRVAGVYGSYVAKRAELSRAARAAGCAVARAVVVNVSGRGLAELPEARAWLASLTRDVVVDAADEIRQLILAPGDVAPVLTQVLNLDGARDTVHACIVREFVRGRGAITTVVDGGVLVEIADGDLLEMNRGLCGSTSAVVAGEVPPELAASCPAGQVRAMTRFTERVAVRDPAVQLEWAVEDGRAYFVDHTSSWSRPVAAPSGDVTVISSGTAAGPLYVMPRDARLVDLSIGTAISVAEQRGADISLVAAVIEELASFDRPPVVYAERPYAILSVLREHVAGFVFDRGALLCHLAILLRESRTPAVVLPDGVRPEPGDEIEISGRRVTVRSRA